KAHNTRLRRIGTMIADKMRRTRNRTVRGLWSSIRHVFNLGSYNRQKQLQLKVSQLRRNSAKTYGIMERMTMLLKATTNQTIKLTNELHKQTEKVTALKREILSMRRLHVVQQEHTIMSHHVFAQTAHMIHKTIIAGTMGSQLLQIEGQYLRDRYEGIMDATHGKLSSLIIEPEILQEGLRQFQTELSKKYGSGVNNFRLKTKDPHWYYKYAKISVTQYNSIWFIEVPVNVFIKEGQYHLYHLQHYDLPLHQDAASNQYTRCRDYAEYVAVSTDQAHYIEITPYEFNNYCTLEHNEQCLAHKVMKPTSHMTCTLAVILGNTEKVKQLCKIEYAILKNVPETFVIYIGLGRYFIMNYNHAPWQITCDDQPPGEIVRDSQIEMTLACGCYLQTQQVETPRYLDSTCAQAIRTEIQSNQYANLVYLSIYLNVTIQELEKNITEDYLQVPHQIELKLPEYDEHDRSDQDKIFDLKKLSLALDQGEIPNLGHLDDSVEHMFQVNDENESHWTITIVSIALGGVVLLTLFILFIRGGQLGRAVAIMSSAPTAEAKAMLQCHQLDGIIILQIIICAIFVLIVFKHAVKWIGGTKASRILCGSWHPSAKESVTEIRLEINSLLHSVDFKLMDVFAPADTLTVIGTILPNSLHTEARCMGSAVVINWGSVRLLQQVGVPDYHGPANIMTVKLPYAVKVYEVSAHQLQHQLSRDHRVNLLIGSHQHYTRHYIGNGAAPQLTMEEITRVLSPEIDEPIRQYSTTAVIEYAPNASDTEEMQPVTSTPKSLRARRSRTNSPGRGSQYSAMVRNMNETANEDPVYTEVKPGEELKARRPECSISMDKN
ncbi:MAG: hypothetical protein DRJ64_05380, partial [Thermoprotei archaeon]